MDLPYRGNFVKIPIDKLAASVGAESKRAILRQSVAQWCKMNIFKVTLRLLS